MAKVSASFSTSVAATEPLRAAPAAVVRSATESVSALSAKPTATSVAGLKVGASLTAEMVMERLTPATETPSAPVSASTAPALVENPPAYWSSAA